MFYKNVNCWFCNQNTRVIFYKLNSWHCSHCEQYNGFKKDGDYNRDISEMRVQNSEKATYNIYNKSLYKSTNCLCERCNLYQQLKMEKLSRFEPKNEKHFDLEIKMYKDYLEKIYTLCQNCQSKVKFEITKQDGILKQYLLNLGMFHNFFERKVTFKNPQLTGNEPESKLNSTLIKSVQLIIMLAILIMTTFIITFNSYETVSGTALQIHSDGPNTSQSNQTLNLLIETLRTSIIDAMCFYDAANLNEDIFFYFNQKIPIFIVLIYVLSCLSIITWPRNEQSGTSLKLVCLVAVVDFLMIFINIRLFIKYLIPELYQPNLVNLNRSLFAIPLIQASVLLQLIDLSGVSSWMKNDSTKCTEPEMISLEPMNLRLNPEVKPVFKNSPFSMNFQQSNIVQQTPKCNYSFLKRENSYSLLKFLNAGDAPAVMPPQSTSQSFYDQPMSNNMKHFEATSMYHQSNNNIKREALNIIKPAKLTTTESYQPLILKNELTTNWRESQDSGFENTSNKSYDSENSCDEGSIVSGLTNLYLGRSTSQKVQRVSKTISSYDRSNGTLKGIKNEKNSPRTPADDDCSFSQFSFYGTVQSNQSTVNKTIC